MLLRPGLHGRRAAASVLHHSGREGLKSPATAKIRRSQAVWTCQTRSYSSLSTETANDAPLQVETDVTTVITTEEGATANAFSAHQLFRPSPTPLKYPHGHNTLLPLVLTSNNLVLPQDPWHVQEPLLVGSRTSTGGIAAQERVIPFLVSTHDPGEKPVGWLLPEVAAAISRDHLRHFQRDSASPWEVRYFEDGAGGGVAAAPTPGVGHVPHPRAQSVGGDYGAEVIQSVAFADWVNEGGRHARSLHVERLLLDWRRKKVFADLLKDWSDVPYPVFNHPKAYNSPEEPLAFAIESSALPIFGLPNYGALLIGHVYDPDTETTKLWIPRRSRTKKNSPGRLDVTVGGGIRLGDTPFDTILRESSEEALLESEYVIKYARSVGTLPFPHRQASSPLSNSLSTYPDPHRDHAPSSGPSGSNSYDHRLSTARNQSHYILPGLYFLYDIELPFDQSVLPQTNILDGEVQSFTLMDLEDVLLGLLEGKFKSSSAMAVVDWLIRHGHVTEENDTRFAEVCRHLRVDVGMPGIWRKRL
ncbi:hypothetical protein EST38_g1985 [Candolleomyces aberdarensis]|uniref:Nudix hydrolase domain-containing protein n=1 Tax=Candolleomyces aberdarensis TaxID=2316362 RepID=A0A4Q2DUR0_9AGAR|nr:hypothetical protein EST38_g1985 [Candolleomyces aberdarensis]